MERNVKRINGNLERLHNLTTEELTTIAGNLEARKYAVDQDLQHVYDELGTRQEWLGSVEQAYGEEL